MYLAIPESFHSIIYGPGIPASSLSCLRHAALLLRRCHFSPAGAENSSGRIWCCRLKQQINTTGRRFAIFFLFVRGPLWWALAQNRKRHRPGDSQEAFKAGFLLRLQQTLIMRREASASQSTSFDA